MEASTSNQASPAFPLRIVSNAVRCSSFAFLSTKGCTEPFPSWSAPGQEYTTAQLSPLSFTLPKLPSIMCIPAIPSQPLSGYGNPVVSQGHVAMQLQFFMYCPRIRHFTAAIAPPENEFKFISFLGAARYRACASREIGEV